MKQQFNSWLLF